MSNHDKGVIMNENQLAKPVTSIGIVLYALPTICTMIFMSLYMIIDGMFVARFVDEFAFSAINIVYPVISSVLALGLMLAMGSSATIGKLLGENEEKKARAFFTEIYVVGILVGGFFTFLCFTFPDEILTLGHL